MADRSIYDDESDPPPREVAPSRRAVQVPKPWVTKYGFMPFQDIDAPGEEYEFLVDGIFSTKAKSMILGKKGSGKSFLATHLGFCVSLERDFFGHKIMKPGLVVIQSGEGAAGMRKRFRAYRQHYGVPDETMIPIAMLRKRINIFRADGDTKGVIEELKGIQDYYKMPVVQFIIDTFSMATLGADEISGKDMGAVLDNIDTIREAIDGNVLVAHHLNAVGNKARGHTSLEANFDEVLIVAREDEETKIRTVMIDKLKDGEDKRTFRFDLLGVETGRLRPQDDQAETSCVCVEVGAREQIAQRDATIGAPIKKNEEAIFRAFWTARQTLGVMADDAARAKGAPVDSVVITSRQFCDVYASQRMADHDDEKPDDDPKEALKRANATARKAWERASPGLIKWGILGFSSPYIWWTGKPVRGYKDTMNNFVTKRGQQGEGFTSDVSFD